MAKAKAICDQIELLFYELSRVSEDLSVEQIEEKDVVDAEWEEAEGEEAQTEIDSP